MSSRTIFIALALMLAPVLASAQVTYRCAGADGKKYYGSTIPPQCYGRPLEQTNAQGTVIRRIDPEHDAKERAEKEANLAKKKEEDTASREEMRRNRALLATYTSERDIEEARRFIAVVDKLFTVERLGWHRHTLAMRLLLPDNIVLGRQSSHDVLSLLESLRTAATEALNVPLLTAFMPHFSADATWLASLETPALLAAATTLHDLIERQGGVEFEAPRNTPELIGSIAPEEWASWASAGTNAFLALLWPNGARHPAVAQRLTDYRSALLELLGQMAQAPTAVQSSQMAQSNPVLDDRLWNLAGAFQDAWGVNTVV